MTKGRIKQKPHDGKIRRQAQAQPPQKGRPAESGPRGRNDSERTIFGVLPVLEALRAENRRVEKILFAAGASEKRLSDVLLQARRLGIPVQKSTREDISSMLDGDVNHQGIVALAAAHEYFDADQLIARVCAKERSLSIILDGIEDPRNLGAILRAAECAGVDAVFIPERRAVGLTETVAKSSAGAIEHICVAKVTNINRLIDRLKENNIWVIGSDGGAATDYDDWDWTQSAALVLGSEGKGLHRLTAEKCDALVRIPMHGRIASLNVSVATGVILFEAVRQRDNQTGE